MNSDARGFPPGDLRVSDAERDQALSELSQAYQAGRITADEFDRRSTLALSARTGKELTVPLADLPLNRDPVDAAHAHTATPRRGDSYLTSRLTIGASLTAICFGAVAVTSALQPGAGWTSALTPAVVAVLCVVLVIVLRARARRAHGRARLAGVRTPRGSTCGTATARPRAARTPPRIGCIRTRRRRSRTARHLEHNR
jgi:hypothetical protein